MELEGHLHAAREPVNERGDGQRLTRRFVERRTHRGEKVRVRRVDGGLVRELQRANERRLELRQKVQRSAEERDVAADRLAAGKARDGLVDDCLKDGGGKVRLGRPLVDERLDIRLGKHAAARGDGIDLLILLRLAVKARGVGLQKRRHLVDERAGAAGADAVHALLKRRTEVDDLRVLAAELDGHVGLRSLAPQRVRDSHDLLHKWDTERLGEIDGARAGDLRPQGTVPHLLARLAQKRRKRLLRVRAMPPVLAEEQLSLLVQKDELHGGGANVDACAICIHERTSFCRKIVCANATYESVISV